MSRLSELKTRLREVKVAGHAAAQIANQLHDEGFKPAKGARITPQIVRIWLSRFGLCGSRKRLPARARPPVEVTVVRPAHGQSQPSIAITNYTVKRHTRRVTVEETVTVEEWDW